LPRPRTDAAVVPARQRIVDAFWQLYRDIDYREITVARVCRLAEVTRSTFYRYFASLNDVLEEIEQEAIPYYIPGTIIETFMHRESMDSAWDYIMTHEKQLEQCIVLMSPHGDPHFIRILKDAMVDAIADFFGVDKDEVVPEERMQVEFVIAGYIGLFSYYVSAQPDLSPAETMKIVNPVVREYLGPYLDAYNLWPNVT